MKRDNSWRARFKRWRNDSAGIYTAGEVGRALKVIERGLRSFRSIIYENIDLDIIDNLINQPAPYKILKLYSNSHPFLRNVHGVVVRGIKKNGGGAKPNFAKKCTECGAEYQRPRKICKECGGTDFRDPDPDERRVLDAFFKDPNEDDEWWDIIDSLTRDGLSTGDWYLFTDRIGKIGNLWRVYVEDSANMFLGADEKGRLGNGIWFCPECYEAPANNTAASKEDVYTINEAKALDFKCKKCSGPLIETAYLNKGEKGLSARYGRDEIIHVADDPWLPKLYGRSKVTAILRELRTATAMSRFNLESYDRVQLAKIIVLKDNTQEQANKVADMVFDQETSLYQKRLTNPQIHTQRKLFLGGKKGAEVHDAFPDPTKMQALEWWHALLVNIVAPIYGIQPAFINESASGKGGGYFARMEISINNETIRSYQIPIEDAINQQLINHPKKMNIKDWKFGFNPVEKRDPREEAQTLKEQIATGVAAVRGGLEAELDDDGFIRISGEFDIEVIKEFEGGVNTEQIPNLPENPDAQEPDGSENLNEVKDKGDVET